MTLITLNFKNYYNRQALKLNTIEEYIDNSKEYDTAYNYDFNPNDGIWASVILNTAFGNADYLLVCDGDTIVSRWYIIESARKRLEQYEVKLLRDVIADNYETVISAPTFIEKATVRYGSPLLFNSENMTFNQIKTSETLIKDRSLCPWIVGYISKNTEAKTVSVPTKAFYTQSYENITDIPYYAALANNKLTSARASSFGITVGYTDFETGFFGYTSTFNKGGAVDHTRAFLDDNLLYRRIRTAGEYESKAKEAWAPVAAYGSTHINNNLATFNTVAFEQARLTSETDLDGFLNTYSTKPQTFKIGGTYYDIRRDEGVATTKRINASLNSSFYDFVDEIVEGCSALHKIETFNDFSDNYMLDYTELVYTLYIEESAVSASYKVDIPSAAARRHLTDAPYDMFCIPYNYNSKLSVYYNNDGTLGRTIRTCNAEAGLSIATQIVAELGTSVYDLQLLPYCPIQGLLSTVGSVEYDTSQYTDNVDLAYIYDTTLDPNDPNQSSIMFWCSSSQFSFNVDKTWEQVDDGVIGRPIDITVDAGDAKVQALCDMHRLVSPNYSSQFEFNAVKNNGVEWFTVDCTYKPYSPYIRVAPNFDGLYGRDFDDARGLICSGDFSLATLTDQWKQYEINNKNYRNAFDRQIENLEVQQEYQRISEVVGATVGTISGGASGAMTGLMAGGGWGALAGGVIGTAAAGVGGAIDVSINDKLRFEALDYTKDQFGYNLGNIRALPYTLNKVSAFNINNKVFPILEYYTCTDVEKQALRDKIQYNGMTVGCIGTIAQYLQEEPTYIKGKVIRLEDLSDDYHFAVAIAEELYKGVFI